MCADAPAVRVLAMSFVNKALRAATAAKAQIDVVRDVRAAASVTPEAPQELDEHQQHVLGRARELGAIDPYMLLTSAEASDIIGVELGAGRFTYSDDSIGVVYAANGARNQRWSVEVSAFHATDDDHAFDAHGYWYGFLADVISDDGLPVPGLGEAAIARDGEVYVLAGARGLFRTEVSVPGGTGATEAAVEAARRVMSRFD
jgi:hypothetical protein